MTKSLDRSEVIWEAWPGAANEMEPEHGWVCEQHPNLPFPHSDCSGPGMPAPEPQLAA